MDRKARDMEPVELLRHLLRTRSINPGGDHHSVAELVGAYLADSGLRTKVLTSPGGHANLVARVEGPTDRPALVLLSHSDVVPVEEQRWTRDPFGAELVDGFVWGRGALDMKGITVMHAVAAAQLAASGATPSREVIVALVGDEEAGGDHGARWLLEDHPDLVGFGDHRPAPDVIGEGAYGIDAGLDRPVLPVALGEKTALWFDVVATGDSGHGALPPTRQAIRNLAATLDRVAGFGTPRLHPVIREQFATLASAASGSRAAIFRGLASPAGSVLVRAVAPRLREAGALGHLLSDAVTPTIIAAGYKSNVVPSDATASFDARLLPDTDIPDFVASLQQEAAARGGQVTNVTHKGHGPVSGKGPLFDILHAASTRIADAALPTVSLSPGITDLRFFRARGASAYGWTPLVLSPELLATIHGHDERIPVDGLDHAVTIMSDVVRRAAS
ncbi:MAG TPA: M20/M25/M40 family metallo-hydrolase [Euzebyales bacterium]|nr:M20/M25/M40 family metallo-hydrolase [Euzebyales bacterium]